MSRLFSLRTISIGLSLAIGVTTLSAADPKAESGDAAAPEAAPAYVVESVALPKNFDPGIGALAFNEAGELVVVSRRTGILIAKPAADPSAFAWRTYCDQILHQPTGVLVEPGGSLLISQKPELTRLYDTDKDSVADYFETVSNAWGVSGDPHEKNSGPLPDGEGNWFVALGTASNDGTNFSQVRGDYSPTSRRGGSFSAAPFQGWIVKITPTGELLPWASGFRQCQGIGVNTDGDLFATDSRGDWKPTTGLYHVEEGKFYGHPASLAWDAEFVGDQADPLAWATDHLDALDQKRTRPAVYLPHGTICDSAGEPLPDDTGGAFGPFTGQMFVGDIGAQRLLRVMLEKVDGRYQGAVTHFIDSATLGEGNHRLRFSPDGSQLFVGQLPHRGQEKSGTGLKRITWTGRDPYALQNLSLAVDGFELTFTEAVDRELAADPSNYEVKHFTYRYSEKSDSSPVNETAIKPSHAIITPDGKGVTLQFDAKDLATDRVYEFDLAGIPSDSGAKLEHGVVCYTLNHLRPPTKTTIEFKERVTEEPAPSIPPADPLIPSGEETKGESKPEPDATTETPTDSGNPEATAPPN